MSENAVGLELTPAQARGLAALITCKSIEAAAIQAGVDDSTIRRWLATSNAFRQALKNAELELLDSATRRMISYFAEAVETLADIMNNPNNHPSIRLKAATALLQQTVATRDLRNHESRILEIERLLGRE